MVAFESCGGAAGLLRSSLMVRFGTVKPDPLTSPEAGSPSRGAFENWPPPDPSGTGPFPGCKLATAISVLALPALLVDPGSPFGGGAAPFENDGAPMPSGNGFRMFGLPTIDASGNATSAG